MRERIEFRHSSIVVEDASSLAKANLIGTSIECLTLCKTRLAVMQVLFLFFHYSFNHVESIGMRGNFLILVFGIPVKNRELLVRWKKLVNVVLSLLQANKYSY